MSTIKAVWQSYIVNPSTQQVVNGAEIRVFEADGGAPATLYADRDGNSTIANPTFTLSDGFIRFYVDAGRYHIEAHNASGQFSRFENVLIGELDEGAVSGAQIADNSIERRHTTAQIVTKVDAVAGLKLLTDRQSGESVFVDERDALFVWYADDRTSEVTADPEEVEWIAPDDDPTGASGAWFLSSLNGVKAVTQVPTITELRALTGLVDGQVVEIATTGRAGSFRFDSSDLSTEVTDDPQAGVYVAPDSDATGASGAWVRDNVAMPVPEWWGAAGVDYTTDTAAFKECIAYGKRESVVLYGRNGATYKIDESLWLGNDDSSLELRGFVTLGATIDSRVVNEPIIDATGIQNGLKFPLIGWRIEALDPDYVATAGIAMARPKQGAGVKSSGNCVVHRNTVYGYFSVAPYYNVQSESNDLRGNHFFQYNTSGHAAAWVRHDYFDDCFSLDYDGETTPLTAGDTITGGTSGATGVLIRPVVDLGSGAGRAWVHVTSGTFVDNETITDTSGGSVVANLPNGYDLIGPASPNATLGVEDDSTASLQQVYGNYFNIVEADNHDKVVFMSDWVDWDISHGNNFNCANPEGTHLHIQQDTTRDAGKGRGPYATAKANYMHSVHAISISLGDEVSGGGTYTDLTLGPQLSAGNPGLLTARVKWVGPSGALANCYNLNIDSDHEVDMRGATLIGANKIVIRDVNNGAFYADEQCEGWLEVDSSTPVDLSGVPDNLNRLNVRYSDLSLESVRRRQTEQVSGGAITVDAPILLIETEGMAAADDLNTINFPSGVVPNGQIFRLRCVNAGRVTTVKVSGGNIRGAADVDLDSTTKWVSLMYEEVANLFYILD